MLECVETKDKNYKELPKVQEVVDEWKRNSPFTFAINNIPVALCLIRMNEQCTMRAHIISNGCSEVTYTVPNTDNKLKGTEIKKFLSKVSLEIQKMI